MLACNHVRVKIGNSIVFVLIDTGFDNSIVSRDLINSINSINTINLHIVACKLYSMVTVANGDKQTINGVDNVNVDFLDKNCKSQINFKMFILLYMYFKLYNPV